MKYNLKSKVLIVTLISFMFIMISTICFAADVDETNKEDKQIGLNQIVTFTGKTYFNNDEDRIWKDYKEGEYGKGTICYIAKPRHGMRHIFKNRQVKHPILVMNEGWIDEDQIISSEKYITIKIDKENLFNNELKINGEYLTVNSTNESVVSFEDGILYMKNNGNANVYIKTKEGKEIELLVGVIKGEIILSIPEKALYGSILNAKIRVNSLSEKLNKVFEFLEIEADEVVLGIELNRNGEKGIDIIGAGKGKLRYFANKKEILSVNCESIRAMDTGENKGVILAGIKKLGIEIKNKMNINMNGKSDIRFDKEKAKLEGEGSMIVNKKEEQKEYQTGTDYKKIFSAGANMKASYKYEEENPKLDELKIHVQDKELVNKKDEVIPIGTAIKNTAKMFGNFINNFSRMRRR